MPGETSYAYTAFTCFLEFGPRRNLDLAAERFREIMGKAPLPKTSTSLALKTSVSKWSARWRWHDRAAAYDDWRRQQIDIIHAREWRKRERRKIEDAEKCYEDAAALRAKARDMLSTSLHKRRVSDKDGKTIEVIPAKWAFRDAAAMLALAAQLTALANEAMDSDLPPGVDPDAAEACPYEIPADPVGKTTPDGEPG